MRERNPVTHEEKLSYLRELREEAIHSASEEAVEKQHAKGKMTARERVEKLLDPGSFEELDTSSATAPTTSRCRSAGPGATPVVTGHGTIDGRTVFVFSQDFTVFGGSLGEVMAEKMCKVMDLAAQVGAPVIGINDSGRRPDPGGRRLARRLRRRLRPQRPVLGRDPADQPDHGPLRGGAVYSPAMTDFIFMVKETSHMFITGPK
jgi:propionyl-CoA carboxylase beta chain